MGITEALLKQRVKLMGVAERLTEAEKNDGVTPGLIKASVDRIMNVCECLNVVSDWTAEYEKFSRKNDDFPE